MVLFRMKKAPQYDKLRLIINHEEIFFNYNARKNVNHICGNFTLRPLCVDLKSMNFLNYSF